MADEGYDEVDACIGIRENRSSLFRNDTPTIHPPPTERAIKLDKPEPRRPTINLLRQKSQSCHDLSSPGTHGGQELSRSVWRFHNGHDNKHHRQSSGSDTDSDNESTGQQNPNCPDVWGGSTGFMLNSASNSNSNVEFGLFDTTQEENDLLLNNNETNNSHNTTNDAEGKIVPRSVQELKNERKLSAPNIVTSCEADDKFSRHAYRKASDQTLSGSLRSSSPSFLKDAFKRSAGSFKGSGTPRITVSKSPSPRLVRGGMGTRINRSIKDLSVIRSEFDTYAKDKLGLLTPGDKNFLRTGSLKVFPSSRNRSTPNMSRRNALGSTHSLSVGISVASKRSDTFLPKDFSACSMNTGIDSKDDPTCESEAEIDPIPANGVINKNTETPSPGEQTPSEVGSVELRKNLKPLSCCGKIKRYSGLIMPILSCLLFLADIGTDFRLAWLYYTEGKMDLFVVTLAFILIPSGIMAVVDLSWFFLDRRETLDDLAKHSLPDNENTCHLVFRVVIGVFSLGRVYRSVMHVYHYALTLSKKRQRSKSNIEYHRHRAVEEKRDYYMLDFINAFAESAPQLLVQLVMLYKFDLDLVMDRVLSLLSSWASIAWAFAAYYRCNREAQGGGNLSTIGFIFVLCAQLCAFLARFVCIALFAVYFDWIVGVVLGLHFVVMTAWTFYQRPPLDGIADSSYGKGLFKLFFGYVQCVSFVNLSDGGQRTRYKMAAFYFVYYMENIVMAAFVAWYPVNHAPVSEENKLYNLVSLPAGLLLHIFFNVIYYWKLHPQPKMQQSQLLAEELAPLKHNDVAASMV